MLFLAKQMPNQASFLYKGGLMRQLEPPAFEIRWQTEPLSIFCFVFCTLSGQWEEMAVSSLPLAEGLALLQVLKTTGFWCGAC